MEPLTWTGSLAVLTPILWTAAAAFVLLAAIRLIAGLFLASGDTVTQPDGTLSMTRGPLETLDLATRWAFYVILGVLAAFLVGGAVLGLGAGIIGGMAQRLIPVWIALALVIGVSLTFRRRLGLWWRHGDQ